MYVCNTMKRTMYILPVLVLLAFSSKAQVVLAASYPKPDSVIMVKIPVMGSEVIITEYGKNPTSTGAKYMYKNFVLYYAEFDQIEQTLSPVYVFKYMELDPETFIVKHHFVMSGAMTSKQ